MFKQIIQTEVLWIKAVLLKTFLLIALCGNSQIPFVGLIQSSDSTKRIQIDTASAATINQFYYIFLIEQNKVKGLDSINAECERRNKFKDVIIQKQDTMYTNCEGDLKSEIKQRKKAEESAGKWKGRFYITATLATIELLTIIILLK